MAIAVVIPSYKVRNSVLHVIDKIGPEVSKIYVVDDCCPDKTGNHVAQNCRDTRVTVILHESNQGVGGAVISGYKAAIADDIDIIVKIDGDGQMDPLLIPDFVSPIIAGEADYTKGNRFYDLSFVQAMPRVRIFGNAILSFMNKISSGYWTIFDPTNGYTAIHSNVLALMPLEKISRRFFFETDMLFRLNTVRAVVEDVPMVAKYGNEVSNLHIKDIVGEFSILHARNCAKRIFYNYYLRDMSVASIELPAGIFLLLFGSLFGAFQWTAALAIDQYSSSGTVMLAALPILLGMQLILAFLNFDVMSVPKKPIHGHRTLQAKLRAMKEVQNGQ